MRRYWLHRISHEMGVSYPLLESGYLSIGFSDFLKREGFLYDMIGERSDKWTVFEKENEDIWGGKYRTRYNLWKFLCEISEGDYVIIPTWGSFYVCEVKGKPMYAGSVIPENGLAVWDKKTVVAAGDGNRYIEYDNAGHVDLGFVIPVQKIVKEPIPRSDYAENKLLSRMKVRQTTVNIDGLSKEVDDAIDRFKQNKPISIYSETLNRLSEQLVDVIKRFVDNDQFERLIKCYFEQIGADDAYIPSKKDGEGQADGDVVARFDRIKLVIYVQAKHHTGTSNEKAVEQISEYMNQKNNESGDSDYNSIAWVVSSAEDFSSEAQELAVQNNVRLINGTEFRKMLVDAGMAKMMIEFSLPE